MTGTLYLIPSPLIPGAVHTISPQCIGIIHSTYHYIAENARSARRFIKATDPPYALDRIQIAEIDKHDQQDIARLISPLFKGQDVGLMSEAGCPGVADPGSAIVAFAHGKGIKVVPLAGSSSVIMALMASGMNGQQFQFHGYLSPKKEQLFSDLKRLEEISLRDHATQIFIETPYRNRQIIEVAFRALSPSTRLCIAVDLTSETGFIKMLTVE